VYRAEDPTAGREVALKQLAARGNAGERRNLEALFEREYHTLVRLRHERIIEVYDYGISESGPYYTMELLTGQDLHERAPLPHRDLCSHLRDIASSLALIHAHRLVHRDVSPRNIRFRADGRAKLIDFGALAPFGPAEDIVGTAICTAPECVHGMPLDQRTDLYSLGAVAYWGLTGRPAYAARQIGDLTTAWQSPPLPPSAYAADVPPELDNLVLSLIHLDPLARPATAAVVIDQLTALAELEPERHEHAASSYLSSGEFVGRDAELGWIERSISRLPKKRGIEILIEGRAGIGKTRLLHEASLRAQLQGITVLKADAHATPEPFGVAAALGRQLLSTCADVALPAAAAHAPVLGHLAPDLQRRLGNFELLELGVNPAERRARLQTALYEWFSQVACDRRLLFAVDNLQAADENSAAFLAALGHASHDVPILLLATVRDSDETLAAPVRAIQRRSGRVKLPLLSLPAIERLITSLFGDVPNTPRLSKLLHAKSAGNPQQCMNLVNLLARQQIVKYVGGTWVLPLDVSDEELPANLDALIATRLAALSPTARVLAEVLSLQTRPLTIDRFRSLAAVQGEAPFHAALDELLSEQIAALGGGRYRFDQDAVRQAVAKQVDEASRRTIHRRTAELLLADGEQDAAVRIEAGWHLLHAGDERRGADILAAAGRGFLAGLAGLAGHESADDAVHALSAALECYEKQGRSEYEIAAVLFPMLSIAYLSEWRLMLEHADRAIELGLRITGFGLARRLRPWVGRRAALVLGLGTAAIRLKRERKRGLDYGFNEAIGIFCGMTISCLGMIATSLDTPRLKSAIAKLEPLGYFGVNEFPRLVHDHFHGLELLCTIRGECVPVMKSVLERLDQPKIKALLGEAHWKSIRAGELSQLGLFELTECGSAALERAREMEAFDIRVWSMFAEQLRMLYHARRGETEEARRYALRAEVFAVQGSTTWQAEMSHSALLLASNVLAEDSVAVRRCREQLARWARQLPSMKPHAALAEAAYAMLSGDLEAAVANFEEVEDEFGPHERTGWQDFHSLYAQALNRSARHAKARAICSRAIAHMSAADAPHVTYSLEPRRQLALAAAGLGELDEAVRQLSQLLDLYGGEDQPLFVGLLYRARAEVALAMSDARAFEIHAGQMAERFRGARNPALIAQCNRLAAKAARTGFGVAALGVDERSAISVSAIHSSVAISMARTALSELRKLADPTTEALRLLIEGSRARAGQLYVKEGGGLRLLCATSDTGTESELPQRLRQLIARAEAELAASAVHTIHDGDGDSAAVTIRREAMHAGADEDADESDGETQFIPAMLSDTAHGSNHLFVLSTPAEPNSSIVGGLILDVDPTAPLRVDTELLQGVAVVLQDWMSLHSASS
ncbi:MAG TPA: protein kinase, partial [Polyangiaceae bacterium]|nr:protein kinase [Polyangiaceae bacterium]